MIQPLVLGHTAMIPTIVVRAPPASAPLSAARPLLLGASHPYCLLHGTQVIPSKEHAYDPNKDPEMVRAKQMFAGEG